MSMEATAKPPQPSLSLPWKRRIPLSLFSAITDASCWKNGTVNRRLLHLFDFRTPPTSKSINGVASHDVIVDQVRNLWFRVYVPTQHAGEDLPVIVFFHGGGFVFISPDAPAYDAVCRRFARKVPAVVVSVNYRLAPEHRYPSQHDDCFDVLKFLDDEENRCKSLPENVNLSRCFVAGDSAGGNLAHHVAQRACEFNFKRLKVCRSIKRSKIKYRSRTDIWDRYLGPITDIPPIYCKYQLNIGKYRSNITDFCGTDILTDIWDRYFTKYR